MFIFIIYIINNYYFFFIKYEWDEIFTQLRLGYFSIPPNQIIGERYYSKNKEYNHKVVDRKVIAERRVIYTTIGKSG